MSVISSFLDILNKSMETAVDPINSIELRKNDVLEIENILFGYNKVIDEKNILEMPSDVVKKILELYNKNSAEDLYNTYEINKKIILSFQEIARKYDKNLEASQYDSALKWFKDITSDIMAYINNFQDDNEDYITNLKKKAEFPKKYLSYFKGDKLASPILDYKEFNEYIDETLLDLAKRVDLKFEIAKANAILLFGKEDNSCYNRYLEIINKWQNDDLWSKLNQEDVSIDSFNEDYLALKEKYDVDEDRLVNILKALLLKKHIDSKDSLDVLDNILNLKVEEKKDDTKKNTNDDAVIIRRVEEILNNEKRLINKVNEKEFDVFLAQSIDSNDEKAIGYKIVSVLTALYTECEKLKNSNGLKLTHDNALGNIRQYIEAYEVLKGNQKKLLEEKSRMVIYLTNKKEVPYIIEDAKKYDEKEKQSLQELLDEVRYGDLSKVKCSEILSNIEVYRVIDEYIKLAFVKLDGDGVMVLNASIINNGDKPSSFVFSNDAKLIENIIKASKEKGKIEKIYAKQKKIRQVIDNI